MAVDALELRPRGAVALYDAAIRVCATSTGAWALTLPAGAALVAALFNLAEAVQRDAPLALPVALWTAAWVFRGLCQGAACHYVDQQVLGKEEPSARASFKAALKRAPSLVIASAYVAVLDTLLFTLTAGIAFLFIGSHAVAFAATMRGQGSTLNLYGTCSKLLGASRQTAAWVRIGALAQLLVALNLQLAVSLGLKAGQSLLGLELTFIDRFTSVDNGTWMAVLAVLTFALFEPLRAATATLLLIDGRVRQEGLDLLAAVEQLPRRRRPKPSLTAAALALVAFLPAVALAQPTALRSRAERLVHECEMGTVPLKGLEEIDRLDEKEHSSLSRFVGRLERRAYDQEDCEAAEADLREGLKQLREAREAAERADAATTRDEAKAILARPEFQVVPEKSEEPKVEEPEPDEPEGWFAKWWRELWEKVFRWLRGGDRKAPEVRTPAFGGPMIGANLIVILAVVLVVALLAYLLLRSRDKKPDDDVQSDESGLAESPLTSDPMSALSRPPEGWAGLADQLAARGDFREAIRHLYLALLSRLHRDGAIDYDPAKSNWDYLRGFKGPGGWLSPFRDLTRRFDFAWYGNLNVNEPAYETFRDTAQPMLTAPSEGPARA